VLVFRLASARVFFVVAGAAGMAPRPEKVLRKRLPTRKTSGAGLLDVAVALSRCYQPKAPRLAAVNTNAVAVAIVSAALRLSPASATSSPVPRCFRVRRKVLLPSGVAIIVAVGRAA
jgi:hypothetical protein